jgi:hypothetical protein
MDSRKIDAESFLNEIQGRKPPEQKEVSMQESELIVGNYYKYETGTVKHRLIHIKGDNSHYRYVFIYPEQATGIEIISEKSAQEAMKMAPWREEIIVEAWVNVYSNGDKVTHYSEENANKYKGKGCIACIKVTGKGYLD